MKPLYHKICVIKDSGLWDVTLCHWVGSSGLWDVTLCHWVGSAQYFEGMCCCILKGSVSPRRVMQTMSHPVEVSRPQLCHRENLKTCKFV